MSVVRTEVMVEEAVLRLLQRWYHTSLGSIEQAHGMDRGDLLRPVDFQVVSDFDGVEERGFPCVAVSSPGVQNESVGTDGRLDGWVQILVGVAVQASRPSAAQRLSKLHLAAARALLVAQTSLEGIADGFAVAAASSYGDGQFDLGGTKVTRASGVCACSYYVRGLAYQGEWPDAPDPLPSIRPPVGPPTADGVDIDATPISE